MTPVDHDDVRLALAKVEGVVQALKQSVEYERIAQASRHNENRADTAELKKDLAEVKNDVVEIKIQTTETNGRVSRHDDEIKHLFDGIGRGQNGRDGRDGRDGSAGLVRDVRTFWLGVTMGAGGLIGAWKFVEWAVHLLKNLP